MFGGGHRERRGSFVATCAVAACFGCSGEDHPPPIKDPVPRECNIRDEACQRNIFEATASAREQEGAAMPSVRTVDLRQLEAELRAGGLGGGEAAEGPWGAALTVVGLLDPGVTLQEASIEEALAGIAAFYDPTTGGVTVIDRGPSDPLEDLFVLAHEFVHALQDDSVGLVAFRDRWVTGTDSLVATKALTEGEAEVLGLAVVARSHDLSPASVDWTRYTDSVWAGVFAVMEASPSPLFAATSIVPYPLGTAELWPLWLDGGQAAIDALYEDPHPSVVDWAVGGTAWATTLVEPLDCYPTSPPDGYVAWDHDSFGVVGAFALGVEARLAADLAWEASLAWRGDELVVFRRDGAGPDDLDVAVAWRTRWASTTDAADFSGLVSSMGTGMVVALLDREVLLWGTTAADAAASWGRVADCGTKAELPASPAPSMSLSSRVSPAFARFTGRPTPAIGVPSWRRRAPADR